MVKQRERSERREMAVVNRGAWTSDEDQKLIDYVHAHGDKNWRTLPAKAGLNRCGKSCRLRWLNYLRPGIKRGNISEDEEDLIIRLHNLLGNRWSLIAGRLPGRTDNEIKNHWNTHLSKKCLTINDLNAKLHQKLEGNTSGTSQTSCSPAPSAGIPSHPVDHHEDSPSHSKAQPRAEELSHQVFDMEELLNLPLLPEFSEITCQYPYQSLSRVLIQPPPAASENLSLDDIVGLMDYRDYFLYFP